MPFDIQFSPTFVFQVWREGGWVMIPLALLSLYIYYQGMELFFHLGRATSKKVPFETWKVWVKEPNLGRGHLGEIIHYVIKQGYSSHVISRRVEGLRERFLSDINPKLMLLSVLVTISPLLGLLGTVIGMLTTFKGLATSAGQTIDMVAEGVRVALITTQTGLIIAIPGYILIFTVLKRRNEYVAILSQVENYAHQQCGHLAAA